jgi:hypothetical protein
MATSTITPPRVVSERRFYTGMSIAILLTVLLGFSRSFFLKPLFPGHPAPAEPIFYVHGMLFTLWILLFLAQVVLVSQGRTDIHRKIGPYGGALVVVMLVFGTIAALNAAVRQGGFIGIPVPPLQFLAIPLFDMIVFPSFVAAALIQRHNSQSHKRLMLLATLNLLPAAIARWPMLSTLGPLAYFGITDLFIIALAIWDIRSRGRIHPVTLWGGLIMIISQPLRLFVSGTTAWISFSEWATSFVK